MSNNCPFELTPYKITADANKPTPVNLNYTNQDFWSMKSRLINHIQQNFGDRFNDFVESSIGFMLIENWAFIADTLSFKIDQIANEVFIDTVTELKNIFRLSKLVGFNPSPPIAAKCFWTARINALQVIDVEIPAPYDVQIVNGNIPINYELFPADNFGRPIYDENIVIPAGNLVNSNIVGLEGNTNIDNYIGNGFINQSYLLSAFPVLIASVRVYVNGERWQLVDFFTDSQPRKEYRLEYNSDYSAYIVFGNNRAGLIPPLNSSIRAVYRFGGGTQGNIITNAATVDALFQVANQSYSVIVNLTNYTKGENGAPGDTVEDIRRKIPLYLKSQDRAVTGEDYKLLANNFITPYNGSTGKAAVVLRHSGCSANIIDIFVLAREGTNGLKNSNSAFKAELIDYLNAKKMLTDNICIKDGFVVEVEININVILSNFYKPQSDTILANILRNLEVFFNLQNWDYGQSLKKIDLLKSLNTITEPISYSIDLQTVNSGLNVDSVDIKYFEIIRPYQTPTISFSYQ